MSLKTVTLTDEIISDIESYRQLRTVECGKPISFNRAFHEVIESVVSHLSAQSKSNRRNRTDDLAKKSA